MKLRSITLEGKKPLINKKSINNSVHASIISKLISVTFEMIALMCIFKLKCISS